MLLTLLNNLQARLPPQAARSSFFAEPDVFIKEQRASVLVALSSSTYSAASDLIIFARRKQEVIDAEPLSSAPTASNLAITSFQPIPPTTGSEFLIRIRRRGRR